MNVERLESGLSQGTLVTQSSLYIKVEWYMNEERLESGLSQGTLVTQSSLVLQVRDNRNII